MRPGPILVVGDVIRDVVATISQSVRTDTDAPASINFNSGGSAANTAVWLGHLGTPVDFVGRVGFGDSKEFDSEFSAFGVRAHLEEDPDLPTGAIVVIVQNESRSMLSDRGANVLLRFEDIQRELVARASWLHLTGYSIFHQRKPDSVADLISSAQVMDTKVFFDASSSGFLEDFGCGRFIKLLEGVDVFRCNAAESMVLTGLNSHDEAAKKLGSVFPSVIVTSGREDIVMVESGDFSVFPIKNPVTSVDPTGAGDSFNAGVLTELSEGKNLTSAVHFGAEVALECVRTAGARP